MRIGLDLHNEHVDRKRETKEDGRKVGEKKKKKKQKKKKKTGKIFEAELKWNY